MKTFTLRAGGVFGLILVIGVLLTSVALSPSIAVAGDQILPSTVLLSASDSPGGITLQWNLDSNAQKYDIYRKTRASISWGSILATLSNASATGYTDTTAGTGSAFEYRVVKTYTSGNTTKTDEAYVYAGNKAPLVDSRGRVILVVDNTYASSLAYELARLRDDLEGDGWTVVRLDVSRTDTPTAVRNRISQAYQADPTNTSHVFLFGHVPVPYSGLTAFDGHSEHTGAWAADVFYGDIDGVWTDASASSVSSCPTTQPCVTISSRTTNFPGDGKFDQSYIPSKVELAVGRVDFANMPSFLPQNEKDLLRQYLNKNHLFRIGGINGIVSKGYTSDQFGFGHEQDTWKDFVAMLGQGQFFSGGATGDTETYLWSRFAGAGYPSGIDPGINTGLIASRGESPAVFNQVFGSWFADWDLADNLLRAFIADKNNGLVSFWAGFPQWKTYRMALGETIGDSVRLSQNIDANLSYTPTYKWSGGGSNNSTPGIQMALMGDPTLRLHTVKPPSNVVVSGSTVSWTPSTDAGVIGYHVYRADSVLSPFVKITSSMVNGTSFTDPSGFGGSTRYMVRAVKLQSSGSGSYYNASQGAASDTFAALSGGSPCAPGAACLTTGSTVAPADLAISAATPSTISVRQGEVFTTTFRYTGGPTAKNWTLFAFLADDNNNPVAITHANAPGYPNMTFSQQPNTWAPGVRNETFSFKAPSTIPPGTYRLITGMYDGADRLSMTNQTGFPAGSSAYNLGYQVATVNLLQGLDATPPVRTLVTPVSGTVTLPAGTIVATLSLSTDEAANCKYATSPNQPYAAMSSAFTPSNAGKTHTATISGLTDGFGQVYSIRCSDLAGNANTSDLSATITVSTPATFNVSKTDLYNVSVVKGETINTQIFITNNSGAPSVPVTFTGAPGLQLPVGLSYSFSPTSCTPNLTCNVSLAITATPSAPTVTGTPLAFALYDGNRPLGLFQVMLTITAPAPVTPPPNPNPNPPPNPNGNGADSGATFANPTSLSGWAWSSTVGWMSFSSNNEASPSGTYGVNRDVYGNLTGYVWNSNVGWIKFGGLNTAAMPSAATAAGTTQTNAKVDPVSGRLSGWVRVCSGAQNPATCSDDGGTTYSASNPDPKGGFSGWISLSGSTAAGPYGVQLNADNRYAGYAWGSSVLGWIQFDVPAPSNPEPQPNIVATCVAPTAPKVKDIATWRATNVSGGNGAYTYTWSGSDSEGPKGSASTASVIYTSPGIKTGSVAVSSGGRTLVVICPDISVAPEPDPVLTATFAPSRTTAEIGDSVTWVVEPRGGNGSYEYVWSGDQSISSDGPTASIAYTSSGQKEARVTVTSGGQEVRVSATMTVNSQNPPPSSTPDIVASCQEPSGIQTGAAATWRVTASAGAGPGTYSYSWQGDDGLNSTGDTASFIYDTPGIKSAGVTVFSGNKVLVVPCSNITVAAAPVEETLTATMSANPSTAYVGESVTWAVQPHGGTGAYTYAWSGSAIMAESASGPTIAYAADSALSGTGVSATVAYSTPGEKVATVVVTSGGQSIPITSTAQILALPVTGTPVVTGSCTAPSGAVAGTNATWTANPGGGNGTYTYSWTGTDGLDGTNRTTSIIYPTAGTKNASVTIFSGDKQLTISCPAASVALPPPPDLAVAVSASPATAYVNEAISWTAVVDGCVAGYTPCTYVWSGSGNISGSDTNTSTSYPTAGSKTGTLTVTSGSRQASASATVEILPIGGSGGTNNIVIGGGASCIGVCETSSILGLTCAAPTRAGTSWTWTATLDGLFKGNQPYKFNWLPSTGETGTLHSGVAVTTDSYTWSGASPAQPGQFPTVSVSDSSLAVNSSQLISCPAVPQENTASNTNFGAVSIANTNATPTSDSSAYKSSVTTQKGRAVALRYGISGGNVDDVYLITQSGPAGSGVSGNALAQQTYSAIVPPTILVRGPFNTEGIYKYTLKIFTKGVNVVTGSPKSVSEVTVTVRTNPDLNEF